MNTSTLSLTIQLPKFEGPLALLLYLIRKEEMDIFDIEIHRITAQYLEFIRLMKELDLEVAGEFIAMASTLIQIKSRMLLPQYNEQGEIIETEDPRKELVQRLLEYQKYQEAGKMLYERPILGRDVWARGSREKFEERILEEIELEENALYSLITSYRRMYRAAQKRIHKVAKKAQSIASRILEIKDRLFLGVRVALSSLIDPSVPAGEEKRRQVLITFLSALELAKMGFVRLFQSDTYQEIHIETVQVIEAAAVSKVEEYESLHNEDGNAAASLEPLRVDMVPEEAPGGEQLSLLDGDSSGAPTSSAGSDGEDFVLRESGDETDDVESEMNPDDIATDDEILAAELALEGVVLEEAPVTAPVALIDPGLDALELPSTPVAADEHVAEKNVVAEVASDLPGDEVVAESTHGVEMELTMDLAEGGAMDPSLEAAGGEFAHAAVESAEASDEPSTESLGDPSVESAAEQSVEIVVEQSVDVAAEVSEAANLAATEAIVADVSVIEVGVTEVEGPEGRESDVTTETTNTENTERWAAGASVHDEAATEIHPEVAETELPDEGNRDVEV